MASSAPIRTAIVGFGLAGRAFHAPFVHADAGYSLDVVVTGSPERRDAAGRLFPEAQLCSTPEEMFAQAQDLDLVVVASPPATHVPMAHRALDEGLAVVLDKPMCVTAAEGLDLVEHADRLGLPLTVFHNRRWDGDFLTLRALLGDGALGEVRRFESRFEWWKPQERKQWKRESLPSEGGGILYDLGPHLIDQAVQLFGPVRTVHAELEAHRVTGVDDDAFVSLLHSSGVRSHLTMNAMAAQLGPRFHVLGSRSAYTKWGLDGQERALLDGADPADPAYGLEPESTWGAVGVGGDVQPVPAERGSYDVFYSTLASAVRGEGPLPVDPRDAVEVVRIIEDIHRSAGLAEST
jgi:predicted dehydrogenase